MSEIKERQLHQILNPYHMDQADMVKSQIWVDPEDKYLLNSVYPIRGVETLLLSGIYKKLCSQLRSENITSYSPENARRAHEIILSYITTLPTGGTGPIENVSGGTDAVSHPCKDSPDLTAHIRKAVKRGQRNGRGKRSGGKETESTTG